MSQPSGFSLKALPIQNHLNTRKLFQWHLITGLSFKMALPFKDQKVRYSDISGIQILFSVKFSVPVTNPKVAAKFSIKVNIFGRTSEKEKMGFYSLFLFFCLYKKEEF